MRIRGVSLYKAVSPLSRPISDSTHEFPEIAFIVTRIHLESGIVGESYMLAFHYSPHAILGALRDATDLVVGWDVHQTREFIQFYESQAEYFGNTGINRWALAAINTAMWDARARAVEKPVWQMFNVHRDRVPVYASGGWLSYSNEELISEASSLVARGFHGLKMRVGSADIERDIERLHLVREAVGPDVDIMMDANQGLSVSTATKLAQAAMPLRITWFEEPLPHTDFEGYRQLGQTTGISLAIGKREFSTVALRELILRDAVDLWQPDLFRLGSVEAWRDSADLCQANNIPIVPHFYKQYHVPLLMTVPNGRGAEILDWVDGLIDHPIRVEDGMAYPHTSPGWGFRFKDEFLFELGSPTMAAVGQAE
ncbi:MAG: mandelate racemase/muconate lactonizing enzyme family protein [Armatimonadetes bacterium]|nr:mandelate racemase/muconate lactonizing enzyme family protein [Armatimonadota bacterium]